VDRREKKGGVFLFSLLKKGGGGSLNSVLRKGKGGGKERGKGYLTLSHAGEEGGRGVKIKSLFFFREKRY